MLHEFFFLKMFQSVVVLCMALFNCVVEFFPYLQCTIWPRTSFFFVIKLLVQCILENKPFTLMIVSIRAVNTCLAYNAILF